MKLTRCLLLIAITVLAVLAQQSNAGFTDAIAAGAETFKDSVVEGYQDVKNAVLDKINSGSKRARDAIASVKQEAKNTQNAGASPAAVRAIRNGYIDCIDLLATAEKTAMDGILSADKLAPEQPELAKQAAQKSIDQAVKLIFSAGVKIYQSLGEALALTNEAAREGLISGSVSVQGVGYEGLKAAESLTNQELGNAGDSTRQALKAAREAVEAGFAGAYNAITVSFKQSSEGLLVAQRNPIQVNVQNLNSSTVSKDSDASSAAAQINDATRISVRLGAAPAIANELRDRILSALGELAQLAAEERQNIENIQKIADIEPSAARILLFKNSEVINKGIEIATAKIYLALGAAGLKAGSPSNKKIGASIIEVETGKLEVSVGRNTAGDLIVMGLRYSGDTPRLGIEAGIQSARYGKLAFFNRIVKAVKIALNFLNGN